ncbi:helix-turn-helix domain-containing protein [Neobacillus mesonae]|uniref:helix-turn-helix domain-containing protein n=1 Tax=Neobacillus mesonae TaxID=1193713 RepID=UPI002040E1F8|nr:AraC family transcriptional regulator [Neobacillus mesonae]MCM3571152.1 AraC family transcriptional regulator [Neobacillus mesonae]
MDKRYFWTCSLRMLSYTFFARKEEFVVDEDIYDSWILFMIDNGSFDYQIEEERGTVEQGDVLVCPPGVAFRRMMGAPIALHFISFEIITNLKLNQLELPHYKTTITDRTRFHSNINYLHDYNLTNDPKKLMQQQHMLNDIWQLTCNEWDNELHPNEYLYHTYSGDPLMNDAYEWLLNNAYSKFNLSGLAERFALSPVQFSRRFQREFHIKPSEFVKRLRIQKAARLLLETNLTLEQIAERCGYDNGFYLSRVFRRAMGVSPSDYRIQNII